VVSTTGTDSVVVKEDFRHQRSASSLLDLHLVPSVVLNALFQELELQDGLLSFVLNFFAHLLFLFVVTSLSVLVNNEFSTIQFLKVSNLLVLF
jgi:hypothetical protein